MPVKPFAPTVDTRTHYPLLGALLAERGLCFKGAYTTADLAQIFGCTRRAVQQALRSRQLPSRPLPGRARCLSCDIEEFLGGGRLKQSR